MSWDRELDRQKLEVKRWIKKAKLPADAKEKAVKAAIKAVQVNMELNRHLGTK